MKQERRIKAIVALLVFTLTATPAWASETASAVSFGATSAGLTHATISLVFPNPVSTVAGFIYACISLGAAAYDQVTDPPPFGAPVINQVVTGPATDFDRAAGEFIASGTPLTSAPVGRIVSIKGSNFSFVQRENVVLFNGRVAPTSPLASNTLISTVVPPVQGPLPAVVNLQVIVNGVPSAPVGFTVLPLPTGGPSAEAWIAQAKSLSQRTRDFDWVGLLDIEAPDLSQAEREVALAGAKRMVRGAERSLVRLAQIEERLARDPNFNSAVKAVLGVNPEVQSLASDALELLGTPQGPPSITTSDLQPPSIKLTASRPGPPAQVDITVQDTGTGLSDIGILHAENVTVSIPQFPFGTTSSVVTTATKVDSSKTSRVELISLDEDCNESTGDPIITLVLREKGKPVEALFTNLPKEEGRVTIANGHPGVTNLLVTVNGARFRTAGLQDNETMTIDVSTAMVEGGHNNISLTASGRPGGSATVVIHD